MQTALISYPCTTCSHLKLNFTILLMYVHCFLRACFQNLLFKFFKINALSGCHGIWTYNHLLCKRTLNHLAKLAKRMSCVESTYLYGALIVCSYHAAYAFRSESTLWDCLNVKDVLAQNRCDIWNLSDCNGIEAHNPNCCLGLWVRIECQISCLFQVRTSLTLSQPQTVDSRYIHSVDSL